METNTFNYFSIRKLIEESLSRTWIDIKNRDREELLVILNDVQEFDETLQFDLISGTEGPVAIQVFTDVNYKGKFYSVIIDFDMPTPNDVEELVKILLEEYEKAINTQNNFKS